MDDGRWLVSVIPVAVFVEIFQPRGKLFVVCSLDLYFLSVKYSTSVGDTARQLDASMLQQEWYESPDSSEWAGIRERG